MKSLNLLKTLALLTLFSTSVSIITTIPSVANTPATTNINTPQSKRFKLTLSGHTEPVRALTLSPNGQILASGSDDKTIKLWNPTTGVLLRTLNGHRDRIKSIIITPDNQTVISSSFDNTIRFWNPQTGEEIRKIGEKTGITAMLLTPDGQTLICGSGDKTIKFRNLKTKKIDRILKVETTALAISSDGKTLFSGGENGGKIRVWSIATGKQLRSFTPPLPKQWNGSEQASAPISLAVSDDGKMLLSGGYDDSFQSGALVTTDGKSFKAWDLTTGKLIHNTSLGTSINALVISPDSKTFMAGGLNSAAILRDIKTIKPVMEFTGHAGGIYGIALSRDGKTLYTGSGDKSVKVWQIKP
ncbi:WD40 repeat domain-containing protein [Calothrix sp. CCY 0018]|uniref:WD40 repeat domain-containing protein n=1 Tax=Calothrix sp. CCY 0018 TaxID=3103864 RepID=UPI0039C5C094